MVALAIVIILIILRPKKLPEGVVAVLGVAAFLLFGLLQWPDLSRALIGSDVFSPFNVVAILVTLAIITTSLDDSGFFKYAAHKAILYSKNNGVTLFRNFFILTVILTGFTSNDIDVLTITPVVLWFSMTTKITPIPYLFAVFVAANTSSMEFVIGNLTNIVIADVFDLQFVKFFLMMIAPTAITLFAQYWLLRLIFRKQLPKQLITKVKLEAVSRKLREPLKNKKQNVFLITVLALVIVGSAISDFLPFEIWHVTSVGAVTVLASGQYNFVHRMARIPWNVVLFVLSFIVLAFGLESLGIVEQLVSHAGNVFQSVWSSVFFASIFSAVTSGFINNIPTSITLSNILYPLTASLDVVVRQAVAYGLVIGTNLGSLFSPAGALATILWLSIIRSKGYAFPIKKFLKYGLLTGAMSVVVASTVIGLELMLVF